MQTSADYTVEVDICMADTLLPSWFLVYHCVHVPSLVNLFLPAVKAVLIPAPWPGGKGVDDVFLRADPGGDWMHEAGTGPEIMPLGDVL